MGGGERRCERGAPHLAGSAVTGFPSVSLLVLGLGFLAPFTALGGAMSMILRRGALLAGFIVSGYLLGAGAAALGYAPTLNLLSWPGGIALASGFPGIAAVTLLILAVREAATRRSPDDDPAPAMPPHVALVGGASWWPCCWGYRPGRSGQPRVPSRGCRCVEGALPAGARLGKVRSGPPPRRGTPSRGPTLRSRRAMRASSGCMKTPSRRSRSSPTKTCRPPSNSGPHRVCAFRPPGEPRPRIGAGDRAIQAAMFAVLGGANEITVLESDPGRADALRQLPP